VLIESGVLANPDEAWLLEDDHNGFKERIAVAVFRGVRAALLDGTERTEKEAIA